MMGLMGCANDRLTPRTHLRVRVRGAPGVNPRLRRRAERVGVKASPPPTERAAKRKTRVRALVCRRVAYLEGPAGPRPRTAAVPA